MSMTMAAQYNEHPARALESVKPHLTRVGAGLSGILGNDGHRFGYHLSPARLRGTGQGGDASLQGAKNRVVDDRAGCAIDIGMDWAAAGEWLDDVRRRAAAGQLPVAELIGDPDLILGPAKDSQQALYAAPSTGWRWVDYTGQGHVTWCHVSLYRSHANDTTFGQQLLGGWSATGRIEEDDVNATQDRLLREAHWAITRTATARHAEILAAVQGVADPAEVRSVVAEALKAERAGLVAELVGPLAAELAPHIDGMDEAAVADLVEGRFRKVLGSVDDAG